MAPRFKTRPRRGRNGNGKAKKCNVTNRQRFNTTSNGLSSRGSARRPMITKPFIEAGSDFLGPLTVVTKPTTAAERIIHSGAVSPSAYIGTRLTQLSNLWERYRFRKFRLRWVPAVPKTLACQLLIYQDTDPLDDPSGITDPDALIRQATAQTGSQQFNFINAMAIDLAKRRDDQLYYTGPLKENERFSRQGNFFVIQVTNPVDMNGAPLADDIVAGSLYVDWVCEFQIAQINPSAVEAALAPVPHLVSDVIPIGPYDLTANVPLTLGTLTVTDPITISTTKLGYETLPAADYLIDVTLDGVSISNVQVTDSFASLQYKAPLHTVLPGTYLIAALCPADAQISAFVFSYTMLLGGTPPTFL